ncbi:MAG: polysaccharide deacetylase family protein [Spirochaetales bacterium]|nr:polysaccharide deacetylase family protein [Spirochaetales bacterium]
MDPNVPKLCALTFDDGPDAVMTPKVLDKLEKYNVPATFFLIGRKVNDQTKAVMERQVKLGCEFGNHSWSESDMAKMTAEQVRESVDKTDAAIKKFTGRTPKFFRPPNLSTSAMMYGAISRPFCEGVLGYDWDQKTTAESRAKSVLMGMSDGAIILLHDQQPAPHPTPEALDIIIPELKKRGYTFVTLSELFKQKGADPGSKKNQMWKFVK